MWVKWLHLNNFTSKYPNSPSIHWLHNRVCALVSLEKWTNHLSILGPNRHSQRKPVRSVSNGSVGSTLSIGKTRKTFVWWEVPSGCILLTFTSLLDHLLQLTQANLFLIYMWKKAFPKEIHKIEVFYGWVQSACNRWLMVTTWNVAILHFLSPFTVLVLYSWEITKTLNVSSCLEDTQRWTFYKVVSFLGPICCFQVTVTMTVIYTVVGRDVLDVSVTIKISKRMSGITYNTP